MKNREYAATVGTFDGLHLGHRDLLERLRGVAAERRLSTCVVTFDTHPLSVLAPERCPGLLGREDFEGIDRVARLHFTRSLAEKTASQFLGMLRDRYDVKTLLMGYNNRIGSDGRITPEEYVLTAAREGIELLFARPFATADGLVPASSTIRKALQAGDLHLANAMLGRPYTLNGTVCPGKRNGHAIGFPTVNVAVDPRRQLPAKGVYAGYITLNDSNFPAVINIGNNPTIADGNPVTIEAHAIGTTLPDLYGSPARLTFVHRLRDERKFDSIDSLAAAIAADVNAAKKMI